MYCGPYVFVAIPLATVDHDVDEKDLKQRSEHDAFLWCWSPFISELASKLDESAWRAVVACNKKLFEKFPTQAIWSDRAKMFDAFSGTVKHEG